MRSHEPSHNNIDAGQASAVSVAPTEAIDFLAVWANGHDDWVRGLTREIMQTRQELSDERIRHFYDQLLIEKRLKEGIAESTPPLPRQCDSQTITGSLTLSSLDQVENVNCLAPSQSIRFNPKMTVVFGENASGKSGYVRVLKSAAGARNTEQVLPNVHGGDVRDKHPKARLNFELDGQAQSVEWSGQSGLAPLNRIDVFDSGCVPLHLDEALNWAYVPGELALFPIIQSAIDAIRTLLLEEVRQRTPPANPFVNEFERGTRIFALMESVSATTDIDDIKALAAVTPEEIDRVNVLINDIEVLRSQATGAQEKLMRGEARFLEDIERALGVLGEIDSAQIEDARIRLISAREAFQRMATTAFAGVTLPNVLQPFWQKFITAGEDLLNKSDNTNYPSATDSCIYCGQPMTDAAIALIKGYRDFCSIGRSELDDANRTFQQSMAPLLQLTLSEFRIGLGTRIGEPDALPVHHAAAHVVEMALRLRDALVDLEFHDISRVTTEARSVSQNLKERRLELEQLSSLLLGQSNNRQQTILEKQTQLKDIQSRQQLSSCLPRIEQFISDAKWAQRAQNVLRQVGPLLRSLTVASKAASEVLLNRNFEHRFADECRRLKAPDVTLEFPGRQGQVARHKSVTPEHKLREILSEGEQKVIALADFLAEIGLKKNTPVIFDDPINSLDYKRVKDVAERLVTLSAERQVVIFTHNIWFAVELLSRFDQRTGADCSYFDIQRTQSGTGVITKGTHPRTDTIKYLRGRINELIQQAESLTGEAQSVLVEKGYEHLRSICEIIVEEELLAGVTRRYQANVAMTKLRLIRYDRLKVAAEEIERVFERCCRFIGSHSQPLETLNVGASIADLKADWRSVQNARDAYRAENR